MNEQVKVFMDGNMFCAVLPDFVNLQKSPAGFGETEEDAINDLHKTLGAEVGKAVQVKTLEDIEKYAEERRALICDSGHFQRPCPAEVIMNMSGHKIFHMIKTGLFVYEKKAK